MSAFQVVLTLHENDTLGAKPIRIAEILRSVCEAPQHFIGVVGYTGGHPDTDGNLIMLCVERADANSVTTADLERAKATLSSHPNVKRFIIGPIESDSHFATCDDSSSMIEQQLVRQYWETEPS